MVEKSTILVVGSINMDLAVRAARFPSPGQTVLGEGFVSSPGGKGANQAVAVARLGGKCRFIGRLGDDAFGKTLHARLKAEHVDCTDLMVTGDAHTGVAMIIVDDKGENSIVVAGGANAMVSPDDLFARRQAFEQAAIVLLQLELPLPTVRAAVDLARRHGCKVVLDPAPAVIPMPAELMRVDVICPNIVEAQALSAARDLEESALKNIASDLIARGAQAAVLKLGPRGCLVVMSDGHFYRVPAYKVPVVDTTGAGDAFTAAFAVAMVRGESYHQAAKFANAAGSLACTRMGAQTAMPSADEVRLLMQDQPL